MMQTLCLLLQLDEAGRCSEGLGNPTWADAGSMLIWCTQENSRCHTMSLAAHQYDPDVLEPLICRLRDLPSHCSS